MSGARLEFESPIEDAISKLKFSPESNNLLIASWDSYLRLYNVETSSLILQLYNRAAALLDCCFENESTSYTSDSDGFIQRYDLEAGTVDNIGRHDDIATSVLYSHEKGEVISTGLDEKIRFWDTRLGQSLVLSTDSGGAVRCITVNGNNLVVCVDASIHLYDLRSLDRPFQSYESQVEVPIRCVTSVPFSTGYAVGSVDGQVALEFPNTSCSSEMKYTFRCHPKSMKGRIDGACINTIEFTPGGSGTFVTGDNEGYVISWNAKSRRRLFELPRYSNSVASLAFNHTGELLAVASSHTYQEAKEKEELPEVFIHKF